MSTLTITDLLPSDWGAFAFEPFEPCATYSAPMDCIVYLREDESYRADRIDQFLTILWHPHEDRVIGIKLKGIRFLFESLRSIVQTVTRKDPLDDKFVPLVGAIELALKMRAGVVLTEKFEKNRVVDLVSLNRSYELARGIVDGVTFDTRQISNMA